MKNCGIENLKMKKDISKERNIPDFISFLNFQKKKTIFGGSCIEKNLWNSTTTFFHLNACIKESFIISVLTFLGRKRFRFNFLGNNRKFNVKYSNTLTVFER